MSEKLPVLITYVVVGILIGMLPILVRFLPQPPNEPPRSINKVPACGCHFGGIPDSIIFAFTRGSVCHRLHFIGSLRPAQTL